MSNGHDFYINIPRAEHNRVRKSAEHHAPCSKNVLRELPWILRNPLDRLVQFFEETFRRRGGCAPRTSPLRPPLLREPPDGFGRF
jgi:hypothetical protein